MTSSALVAAMLWLTAPAALSQEPALDPSGLPAPAWYSDEELGLKWERLTGKYIFQRSCTECHSWGPQKFTRAEWSEYLESFPGNHAPPVSTYSDLTALFTPAAYVPDARQLGAALSEFLLHSAPASPVAEAEREVAYEGFPRVGEPAPDFEIVDIEGHRHKVSEYTGKKQLVVVFSRAHW